LTTAICEQKSVQSCQFAVWRQFEYCAAGKDCRRPPQIIGATTFVIRSRQAPANRCAVEVAIDSFDNACARLGTVGAVGPYCAKAVKRGQCAGRGDLENCALAVLSAAQSSSVEIAVAALYQGP